MPSGMGIGVVQDGADVAASARGSRSTSTYVVCTDDRTMHPESQRKMAKHADDHVVEWDTSHSPMLSRPDLVADLLAALAAQTTKASALMTTVQTVTGPVDGADLGRTLVHEHIRISYDGEELDPTYSWDRAETVERAVDKMGELLDAGFRTFVDPCPIELGRDPELYAEIASRSGMQHRVHHRLLHRAPRSGACRSTGAPAIPEEIAELYVRELTEGIAGHGRHPRRGDQGGHRHRGDPGRVAVPDRRRARPARGRAARSSRTPRTRSTATCSRTSSPTAAPISVVSSSVTRTSRPTSRRSASSPSAAPSSASTASASRSSRPTNVAPTTSPPWSARASRRRSACRRTTSARSTAPRSSFYVPPREPRRRGDAPRADRVAGVAAAVHLHRHRLRAPAAERGVTDADVETIFVDNPRRLLTGA